MVSGCLSALRSSTLFMFGNRTRASDSDRDADATWSPTPAGGPHQYRAVDQYGTVHAAAASATNDRYARLDVVSRRAIGQLSPVCGNGRRTSPWDQSRS